MGVERAFDKRIFEGNVWGLQWFTNNLAGNGLFPQYYQHVGNERVAVPPPTRGRLVALDPALLVVPPEGLEVGYVPIVTHQAAR